MGMEPHHDELRAGAELGAHGDPWHRPDHRLVVQLLAVDAHFGGGFEVRPLRLPLPVRPH
eukprot:CAMPEP_0118938426 /NCGR_PEP_ID=MMETSP1169-20130426/25853_1 /TAXON_ID=36882 /ORGANISM="Pyramimonas obovata, Strain CCMP722" /LENGTH=59 /DNA_ID=CAMNT_0006882349 /DNA_START=1 /DNA_END=177 /DNA_ORIENTATION=-